MWMISFLIEYDDRCFSITRCSISRYHSTVTLDLNENQLILSSSLMFRTMFVSFILLTTFINSLCLFWFCRLFLILAFSSSQVINLSLKRQRAFTTRLMQSNMYFSETFHMIAMSKNLLSLSLWSSR